MLSIATRCSGLVRPHSLNKACNFLRFREMCLPPPGATVGNRWLLRQPPCCGRAPVEETAVMSSMNTIAVAVATGGCAPNSFNISRILREPALYTNGAYITALLCSARRLNGFEPPPPSTTRTGTSALLERTCFPAWDTTERTFPLLIAPEESCGGKCYRRRWPPSYERMPQASSNPTVVAVSAMISAPPDTATPYSTGPREASSVPPCCRVVGRTRRQDVPPRRTSPPSYLCRNANILSLVFSFQSSWGRERPGKAIAAQTLRDPQPVHPITRPADACRLIRTVLPRSWSY